jgi:branched chain amino acid efflux pump
MTPLTTWLTILCVTVVVFLLRASFIVFADPHKFSHRFRQALAFVPPSVLAAIVAPGLLMSGDTLDFSPGNERLIAGLAAIVATIFIRNAMAAIATGMAALWLLRSMGT